MVTKTGPARQDRDSTCDNAAQPTLAVGEATPQTYNPAIAQFRARYRTHGDDAERPTGSLSVEQLAVLSALPASSPQDRDAWWEVLRERLDRV